MVDLGPGAGPLGGASRGRGPSGRTGRPSRIPSRASTFAWAADQGGCRARDWRQAPGWIEIRGASLHNLKMVDVRIPLGGPHVRDGCQRLRKEHAGARRARANGAPVFAIARAIVANSSRCFGLERDRSARPGRPVADRPQPALDCRHAVGLFAEIRRVFAHDARSQDARVQGQPVLVQCQGRPLRSLPGIGQSQDTDALSSRSARDVRGMRRQAIQSPDAGRTIQGKVDRRYPGDAGR